MCPVFPDSPVHSLIPPCAFPALHTPQRSPAAVSAPNLHSRGRIFWPRMEKDNPGGVISSFCTRISFPASLVLQVRNFQQGLRKGWGRKLPQKSPKQSKTQQTYSKVSTPTALSPLPAPSPAPGAPFLGDPCSKGTGGLSQPRGSFLYLDPLMQTDFCELFHIQHFTIEATAGLAASPPPGKGTNFPIISK